MHVSLNVFVCMHIRMLLLFECMVVYGHGIFSGHCMYVLREVRALIVICTYV